jgi:uncharacterized membrane protein YphA (DoxX/SURF4 family)
LGEPHGEGDLVDSHSRGLGFFSRKGFRNFFSPMLSESDVSSWPQVMAPFVGVVEIVCGSLLLIGLITRLAAIPLLVDICIALYSTKIVTFAKNGFWGTLHEARTDVSMLLGLIFLLLVGGGAWSLDAKLSAKRVR